MAYARQLDKAGAPAMLTGNKEFIPDCGMLYPLARIQAVQVSIQQASIVLKNALFSK